MFSLILIWPLWGSVDVLTKIQVTLTSSSKLPSLTFTDVDFDDSSSIEVDRTFSQCSSCLTLELTLDTPLPSDCLADFDSSSLSGVYTFEINELKSNDEI